MSDQTTRNKITELAIETAADLGYGIDINEHNAFCAGFEVAYKLTENKDEEIERLKAILKVGNKTQKINELEATIQSLKKQLEEISKETDNEDW